MSRALSEDAMRLIGPGGALPADVERPLLALATHPQIGAPDVPRDEARLSRLVPSAPTAGTQSDNELEGALPRVPRAARSVSN